MVTNPPKGEKQKKKPFKKKTPKKTKKNKKSWVHALNSFTLPCVTKELITREMPVYIQAPACDKGKQRILVIPRQHLIASATYKVLL